MSHDSNSKRKFRNEMRLTLKYSWQNPWSCKISWLDGAFCNFDFFLLSSDTFSSTVSCRWKSLNRRMAITQITRTNYSSWSFNYHFQKNSSQSSIYFLREHEANHFFHFKISADKPLEIHQNRYKTSVGRSFCLLWYPCVKCHAW